jgi:hypothetical protein
MSLPAPGPALDKDIAQKYMRHLVTNNAVDDADRKSTRLNSSHNPASRMPSSA